MGSTSAKRPLSQLQISDPKGERLISKPEFQRLAEVPPEVEWFANLTNENTRRAYRNDVTAFMRFVGIKRPEEFRAVTRAHVIAWRKILEQRKLAAATVRRKLSALSDLYNYLCDANAVPHNPVNGKIRYIPVHPRAIQLLEDYLDAPGHRGDAAGALFRSVAVNLKKPATRLREGSVYRNVVMHYCKRLGIAAEGLGPHALRATSATSALFNGADIAQVQEWLGHSSISTTRLYDKRKMRPEDSPTFRVKF